MKLFSWLKKNHEERCRPSCAAVIVAAGSSVRFGGNKLFVRLSDKPVLAHTLLAFQGCELIDEIVIVARSEDIIPAAELCKSWGIHKATQIIAGGERRMDSSLLGVCAVSRGTELVAIHDGARPLVTPEIIAAAVEKAAEKNAVMAAVPLKDTVKVCENGAVKETLDRASLMAAQTPQVFNTDLIKGALSAAVEQNAEYTDDCAAAEAFGVTVYISAGSDENLKITTPADLAAAEAVYERRLMLCE